MTDAPHGPSDPDGTVEPRSDEVEAFWNVARFHAKLNSLPSYFGPTPLESVPPPSWSFGDDGELGALLTSRETVLTGTRAEYGDELPEHGALGIVCDAHGRPRALVVTAEVTVFGDRVSERLAVVWAPDDHGPPAGAH